VAWNSSPNMHNTGFFPDSKLSASFSNWWLHLDTVSRQIFGDMQEPNSQVGARGKRRGFSPRAAARHKIPTVGPESLRIFIPAFWSVFLTTFVIGLLPRVLVRKIWDQTLLCSWNRTRIPVAFLFSVGPPQPLSVLNPKKKKKNWKKSLGVRSQHKVEKRRGKENPLENNTLEKDKISGTLVRLLWLLWVKALPLTAHPNGSPRSSEKCFPRRNWKPKDHVWLQSLVYFSPLRVGAIFSSREWFFVQE